MINYNDYINMERKDLEILSEYIKNILVILDETIIECFEKKDLNGIKEVLKNDSRKKIPNDAWELLDFSEVNENNLDFFLYIKDLPGFEKYENKIVNEIISSSYQNIKVFDFFIENPNYSKPTQDMASNSYADNKISKQVIGKLIERKLINISLSEVKNSLKMENENYLEYYLENNVFEFSKEDYTKIYTIGWNKSNENLMNLVKDKFPDYKKISLISLIDSIVLNVNHSDIDVIKSEKMRFFLNFDNPRFINTIKEHSIDDNAISQLIIGFSKEVPIQEKKYGEFVSLILNDFPENIEVLKSKKSLFKFGNFKKVYDKSLDYINLNLNLELKENKTKKMKI